MEKLPIELVKFIDQELEGFRIQELTEVYTTNEDGQNPKSLRFFKSESLARAFVQNQPDANWHKTKKAYVLTDGKIGFLLGREITLFDDEIIAQEIKKKVLAKLSDEERGKQKRIYTKIQNIC